MLNKIAGPVVNMLPSNSRLERIWKLSQTEFKKRYYNDNLGLIWALLDPILKVSVYYWIFTYVFNKMSEGIPNYALFLFGGIISWQAFIQTVNKCMKVLISKSYLIESVNVNKVDLYISSTIANSIGYMFNLAVYLLACLTYGISLNWSLIWLVPITINVFIIAIGLGMLVSVIYIYLKDIDHLMTIVFLFGFWTAGIFFKADVLLENYPILGVLNPFLGIISNVRGVTMFGKLESFDLFFVNLIFGVFIYFSGYFIMKKYSFAALEKL